MPSSVEANTRGLDSTSIAVRGDGALRGPLLNRPSGYGAAPQTPGDSKKRPDSAWLALEERVAMQVSNLHQKHAAEQMDAERVLRGSVNKLESRVRALEGQSVRSDRRVAEMQGLAQALTEEQRALLIRLDRLEEHMRGSKRDLGVASSGVSEEWHRRLNRLEREHRATALNLRLVVSVTAEGQQKQQRRLRAIEDRLQMPSNRDTSRSASPFSPGDGRGGSSGSTQAASGRRSDLMAAELSFSQSLEAAQHLLRRCESNNPGTTVGTDSDWDYTALRKHLEAGASDGDFIGFSKSAEFVGALRQQETHEQVEDLGQRVKEMSRGLLRMDTLEATVRAIQDTLEELQVRTSSQRAEVEVQDIKLSEVRTQLTLMPTHEQVAATVATACRREKSSSTQDLEELRQRIDAIDHYVSTSSTVSPSVLEAHSSDMVKRLEERHSSSIAEALARLDQVATRNHVEEVCKQTFSSHAREVEQLRARLEEQVNGLHSSLNDRLHSAVRTADSHAGTIESLQNQLTFGVSKADMDELRARLETISAGHAERSHATSNRVDAHVDTVENLRQRLDELATGLSNPRNAPAPELDVADLRRDCSAAVQDLNVKFDNLASAVQTLQDKSEKHLPLSSGALLAEFNSQETVKAQARLLEQTAATAEHIAREEKELRERLVLLEQHSEALAEALMTIKQNYEERAHSPVPGGDVVRAGGVHEDLASDLKDLQNQCDSMQEVIEHELAVKLWAVERHLPEAQEKVDRLLGEHADRMGKVEEHDIRLNSVLTKLDIAENKVQSCIDKIENQPTKSELRGMWRQDVFQQLREADMEGLQRKADVQGRTLDDLHIRFMELCNRLCCPDIAVEYDGGFIDSGLETINERRIQEEDSSRTLRK